MLLNEALIEFKRKLSFVEQKSLNTVNAYVSDVNKLIDFLKKNNKNDTKNIDLNDLSLFFNNFLDKEANSSKNRILTSIKRFYEFLNTEYNEKNIAAKIKPFKKIKHLPKTMNCEQILDVLSNVSNEDEQFITLILSLLYGAGMRVSEACGLSINDINLEERTLLIHGKGSKERLTPIGDDLYTQIIKYLPIREKRNVKFISNFLITKQGKRVNRQFIFDHLKKRLKSKNISPEFYPHSLRHSYATKLAKEGVNFRIIQELLGHSDASTTQIYTHLQNNDLKNEYFKAMPRK